MSTVRRHEGERLHPTVDDGGVRWFDEMEVAALAAELSNATNAKPARGASAAIMRSAERRTAGEIAALVFERFEQRHSLPEIVVGLCLEPDLVRGLYEQWCLGLVEGQLRMQREPHIPRANEIERCRPEILAKRLGELPAGKLARISVARYRESFQHGEYEYPRIHELGGFHISGPCTVEEISRRFGPGSYRVTAYDFDPPSLRWELLIDGLPSV